jgi:N,N'-diacetyllegionaminate synthase
MLEKNDDVFVIAEAGSNWKCGNLNDDIERAKELIKIASKAGANAIKFQVYRSETTYAPNAGQSDYLKNFGIEQDIHKLFDTLSMPYDMIPELADYCQKNHINFMATPFSIKDAQMIDEYVDIHKVASYEINHIKLLEFLIKTKKPVIISTGASTYEEIDFAYKILKKNSIDLSILQCTACYPCPLTALNLSVIPKLMERYCVPVGLSDHSTDPIIAPVIAVGLGSKIIEKHFTLDKNLPGPDHNFALNPDELVIMIDAIRKCENTLGSGEKIVLPEELELRKFATRSIQAIRQISKGDIFKEGINFEILRPGNNSRGLDARFFHQIEGKKSQKTYNMGEGIFD